MKHLAIALTAIFMLTLMGCGAPSLPTSSPEEVLEFSTNPTAFEGKTLTVKVTYGGPPLKQVDFDDGTWNLPFRAKGTAGPEGAATPYDFFFSAAAPKGFKCSSLNEGDEVTVVFECTTGELTNGNLVLQLQ